MDPFGSFVKSVDSDRSVFVINTYVLEETCNCPLENGENKDTIFPFQVCGPPEL